MTAHLETIMPTLSDLRRALDQALTHLSNPAILRLPESERTAEGILRAYLPGSISQRLNGRWFPINVENITRGGLHGEPLDLSDPGTAHAVVVALALALGLDPGVGGLAVRWWRRPWGWLLEAETERRRYGSVKVADPDNVVAPSVALEPDHIKALARAVRHILETP